MIMDITNYLDRFFARISADARISVTHISVFTAILQTAGRLRSSTLSMFGFELMQLAKISSGKTYYRTVRELSEFGYIVYEPSFKKNRPSTITLPEQPG